MTDKQSNPFEAAAQLLTEWWANAGIQAEPVYCAMGAVGYADGSEFLFPVGPLRMTFAEAALDGAAKNATVALLMRAIVEPGSQGDDDKPKPEDKPKEPEPTREAATLH